MTEQQIIAALPALPLIPVVGGWLLAALVQITLHYLRGE
jgi:hypothetical protein